MFKHEKGKFQMPKIIFDAQANPQIFKKEVLNLQKRDISIALLTYMPPPPPEKLDCAYPDVDRIFRIFRSMILLSII